MHPPVVLLVVTANKVTAILSFCCVEHGSVETNLVSFELRNTRAKKVKRETSGGINLGRKKVQINERLSRRSRNAPLHRDGVAKTSSLRVL